MGDPRVPKGVVVVAAVEEGDEGVEAGVGIGGGGPAVTLVTGHHDVEAVVVVGDIVPATEASPGLTMRMMIDVDDVGVEEGAR